MKYYGSIGYAVSEETEPGVWEERIEERNYYGDVLKFYGRGQDDTKVNGEINIQNQISIVADPYAYNNFFSMRYLTFSGAKWKITNVDIQQPRIIINLGGLYHEQTES